MRSGGLSEHGASSPSTKQTVGKQNLARPWRNSKYIYRQDWRPTVFRKPFHITRPYLTPYQCNVVLVLHGVLSTVRPPDPEGSDTGGNLWGAAFASKLFSADIITRADIYRFAVEIYPSVYHAGIY